MRTAPGRSRHQNAALAELRCTHDRLPVPGAVDLTDWLAFLAVTRLVRGRDRDDLALAGRLGAVQRLVGALEEGDRAVVGPNLGHAGGEMQASGLSDRGG